MNVEEGELRPQLLDRFGLGVEVRHADRPGAVAPRSCAAGWPSSATRRRSRALGATRSDALAARIAAARDARCDAVRLPERELLRITGACAKLGVDGVRGDIVCARAAARAGRARRRRRGRRGARAPRRRARARAPPPPRPARRPRRRRARSSSARSTTTARPGRAAAGPEARRPRPAQRRPQRNGADSRTDAPVDAPRGDARAERAGATRATTPRCPRGSTRRGDRAGRAPAAARPAAAPAPRAAARAPIDSRPARAGVGRPRARRHACAAARCSAHGGRTLREHVRAGREGALLCLVVDASGSMGARSAPRPRQGRAAGRCCATPTRAATASRHRLPRRRRAAARRARRAARARRRRAGRELPTGGRTPLAAGLARRRAAHPPRGAARARPPVDRASSSPTAASSDPDGAMPARGRAPGPRRRRRARRRHRGRARCASASPPRSRPPPAPTSTGSLDCPRGGRMSADDARSRATAPTTSTSRTARRRGSAEPRRRKPRDRPLVIVVTGHGKGKSTSAFGMLLRSWARGYRCGVFQFVKSGKWKVGEAKAAAALGGIDWEKMGDGWSWLSKDLDESADLAREGWERGQARDRAGALRVPAARRDHLPDQVGLDRRRGRRRHAARPPRLPARRDHRPRRRARADRARRPRLRGGQGQAPDGRGHPRPAGDRVVDVLVILDGASEPLRRGAARASSARARRRSTALAASGDAVADAHGRRPGWLRARRARSRRCWAGRRRAGRTAARWRPPRARSRSGPDERAWRVDVRGAGARTSASMRARGRRACAPRRRTTVSRASAGTGCWSAVGRRCPSRSGARGLRVWPEGVVPPRVLGPATVVIAAAGAAAGLGRLMGATVVVPDGATGGPDTDLHGQGAAARRARSGSAPHAWSSTSAAPTRRPTNATATARSPSSSASTRELLRAARARGRARPTARSRVCPDHGCDPRHGRARRRPGPVPALVAAGRGRRPAPPAADRARRRHAGRRGPDGAGWWSRERDPPHRRRGHELGRGQDHRRLRADRRAARAAALTCRASRSAPTTSTRATTRSPRAGRAATSTRSSAAPS